MRSPPYPTLVLALAAVLALAGCAREAAPSPSAAPAADAPRRVRVAVGMHVIRAEVADTEARKERGLSGREGLRDGEGMLFPYERPGRPGFWMRDMRFDLDLIWIRGDRVVEITPDVSHAPARQLDVLQPAEPVDRVLEVAAGTAERLGWQVGDPVHIEPEP